MKTIVYTEYGPPDVLHLKEVEKPAPKDNEVQVRVRATTVNFGDVMARNFKGVRPAEFSMPLPLWIFARIFTGWNRPRVPILGSEFSGDVEALGKDVQRFKPGDPVFGYLGQSMGADAEYLCMRADGTVALKPANMTYEEAAAVPYGAIMALDLLKKANIQPGQKVLINGASGGIGSIALQLAKYYGAEVTGVCGTPRLETVKSLGADKVIDYTVEDFTRNGETYDVIFDILGKASFSRCKNSLKPGGRILYASFKMKQLFQMLWTSMRGGRKVICALANESPEALDAARELVQAGKLKVVIDRCYPLELAAEAHRYYESRRKTGNVILTV